MTAQTVIAADLDLKTEETSAQATTTNPPADAERSD